MGERSIVWSGWPRIATTIKGRALAPGEPLRLAGIAANLALDDDSDAEAYRWLALMVENVEREDGVIEAV